MTVAGMNVVILAGGFGTRLRELVPDVPKPMAMVAGRPFLELLLTSLADKGFRRAVLSLGHMANVISQHFGSSFQDMDLFYEVEQKPLGTGGAICAALNRCDGHAALVLNGDTFLDFEVSALHKFWASSHRPIIVGRAVDDTARFGRLNVTGDRLIGFAEKGASGSGIINTGHYILPTNIFDGYSSVPPFSFESDFLTQHIQKLEFQLFLTQGQFIDIGVPEDYQRAQTELLHLV